MKVILFGDHVGALPLGLGYLFFGCETIRQCASSTVCQFADTGESSYFALETGDGLGLGWLRSYVFFPPRRLFLFCSSPFGSIGFELTLGLGLSSP